MSETTFRNYLRKKLDPYWVATSHEDCANDGIPDISYAMLRRDGWIELKILNFWPRKNGVVRLDHFTTQQKDFLIERGGQGSGHCYMFLKIEETSEYLLFHWTVIKKLEMATREEFLALATATWQPGINQIELIKILTE